MLAHAVAPALLRSMPVHPPATAKRDRHRAILDIVGAHVVGSQEELRRHLHGRGWDVTQSTLSRDLHELRLARVPTGDGMRYVATGTNGTPGEGGAAGDRARLDQARATLAALLPQLFERVDGVGDHVPTVTRRLDPTADVPEMRGSGAEYGRHAVAAAGAGARRGAGSLVRPSEKDQPSQPPLTTCRPAAPYRLSCHAPFALEVCQ